MTANNIDNSAAINTVQNLGIFVYTISIRPCLDVTLRHQELGASALPLCYPALTVIIIM